METVYGDLLFLINFSMDFLCFFLTAKLLHRKLYVLRFTVASAFGALYALIVLFFTVSRPLSIAVDLAVCFVMCLVAFMPKQFKINEALLLSAVYAAISMMLGGVMTAMFNLVNRAGLDFGGISDDGISPWLFAAFALVSFLVALLWGKFFRRRTSRKSAKIKVTLNGKSVEMDALCDSGNLLRDPISRKCVIVADKAVLEGILSPSVLSALGSGGTEIDKLEPDMQRRVRLIPSKSAHAKGLMGAILPDSISVSTNKGSHTVDALIAPVDSLGGFDSYGALLPTELLV